MSKLARRRAVNPGETVRVELAYSEVCMHLRVAGTIRRVTVLDDGAQILNADGSPFSFPIHHGEAGLYRDWSVKDRILLHAEVEPEPCATVGCDRASTHAVTWLNDHPPMDEPVPSEVTELVCKPCGERYASRPALKAKVTALPA